MGDRSEGIRITGDEMPAHAAGGGYSAVWFVLPGLLLLGAIAMLLARGPWGEVLSFSAAAIALLVYRLMFWNRATSEPALAAETLKELLDSAGPMVVSVGLDGRFTYMNPAAERLLGYSKAELLKRYSTVNILAPAEGARLLAEMERVCGVQRPPESTPSGRVAAYLSCLQTLPHDQTPHFNAQVRRKDGALLPVILRVSALRDGSGAPRGLVVVAVERSTVLAQEQYEAVFENSSEMIATLGPKGQFLFANYAWKHCFGLENAALLSLGSFEEIFGSSCRTEAGALFRCALDGELVECAPLCNHTSDGRVLDLELSLYLEQKVGDPLTVRCLLRDVTQQKQREHRLALQLVVSQIVGENSSPAVATTRILEALCVSQGWDVAFKWKVNSEENRLEFSTAWGVPGIESEAFIQESRGLSMVSGSNLPGRVWQEGRTVWMTSLDSVPASPRVEAALRHAMVSGWAVPVRVGNKVLAVLEFYSHFRLLEDRESIAAVETVAASLGQMLARTLERGRAEDLYRQQEILLNSVADGICGVNRHGQVSFVNPAAARLLGSANFDLTGQPVHELLHGAAGHSRRCDADCPLLRATSHRMPSTGEDILFRTDGTSFPAEYALTPILDQGHFSGSVLSFRDISQRFALDRLKDEFISTVSHELRTPLTSIRGALGLLSSGILGEVNDKAANLLRIALTNSDRLVRLINDILDLERIQSGREPHAYRPVQLGDIVCQAIEGMQPVAEAAGVHLIHDNTQVEIAADPDLLVQVLTNLLSNAVKFSPANSSVSVMLRPGADGVTLSVIDQGRGIPADKLEAIFGRFQQVDASDSRQKGGTGLGLAICRTIVQQHSGRIWAERNAVCGSTFRVFLPYRPVPAAALGESFNSSPGIGAVLQANAETQNLGLNETARFTSDEKTSFRNTRPF